MYNTTTPKYTLPQRLVDLSLLHHCSKKCKNHKLTFIFRCCFSGDKMTPSPVTSQATTQSGNHNRGPATPQTPGSHAGQKGATDRTQHPAGLPQAPVSGNADSIAADLDNDNLPDEFNFGVLEGDHAGGTDGVEGALDVSFKSNEVGEFVCN